MFCVLPLLLATAMALTIQMEVVNEHGYSRYEPGVMGVSQYGNVCPRAIPDCYAARRLETLGIRLVGSTEGISGLNATETHWTVDLIREQMRSPAAVAQWNAGPLSARLKELSHNPRVPSWWYSRGYIPNDNLTPPGAVDCKDCVPRSPVRWGTAQAEYLRHVLSDYPQLAHTHILNEPNAHWWKVGLNGTDYAAFFLTAASVMRQAHPDIAIGGPVTWCPPSGTGRGLATAKPWNTWADYALPMLDMVLPRGLLSYYDFHSYNDTGAYLAGEIALVAGYARTHGHSLRSAITENNIALQDPVYVASWSLHWQFRALPLAIITHYLLRSPDKLSSRHVFDWHVDGLFPIVNVSDPFTLTPTIALFQLLHNSTLLDMRRLSLDSEVPSTSASDLLYANAGISADAQSVTLLLTNGATGISQQLHGPLVQGLQGNVLNVQGHSVSAHGVDFFPCPLDLQNGTIVVPPLTSLYCKYALVAPQSPPTVVHTELFSATSFMRNLTTSMLFEGDIALPSNVTAHSHTPLFVRFGVKGGANASEWTLTLSDSSSPHRSTLVISSPGPYAQLTAPSTLLHASPSHIAVRLECTRDCDKYFIPSKAAPTFVSFVSIVVEQIKRERDSNK